MFRSMLVAVVAWGAVGALASDLQDSVRSVERIKIQVPEFPTTERRLAYLRWMGATSAKLAAAIPDPDARTEFVQTVWYEGKRAGLDLALVLAAIETLSGFHKVYVSSNGALGYLAVHPMWASKIGNGDVSKLMELQTNLRFGCVLMRHYLDQAGGDKREAITRYVTENFELKPTNPKTAALVNLMFLAWPRWVYADPGQ